MIPRSRRRLRRVAVITDAVTEVEAQNWPALARDEGSLEPVKATLGTLGWDPVVVEFDGDPAKWLERLSHGDFELVFNLFEGLIEQPSHEYLAAAAVELLDIPMTGARSLTLALCLDKDKTNTLLRAAGMGVPDWTVVHGPGDSVCAWEQFPAIVKPVDQDSSLGIHGDCVVHDSDELRAALGRGQRAWGRMMVQRFVAGRELNVSIVGDQLLPPAEIDFSGLPAALPHVVSYAAKWEDGTAEALGTVPRCPARLAPRLAREVAAVGRRAWQAVGGTGYGRIDLRIDAAGGVYVIDVNPNADLSPTAGLARQAAAAGWSYRRLVARIVEDALARAPIRASETQQEAYRGGAHA